MLEKFERDEGLRHFERGIALERANRISEAVKEYRQAVERYPHLREAHVALGFYYQRNGLLAKAAEEFHTVANLEGDFLSYFNLGHILVELQRYDQALEAFHECLKHEPNDAATHYEIAYIHYQNQRYHTALHHLHIPVKHYPDDWEVHYLIGRCHLANGQYQQALRTFMHALPLAPTPQARTQLHTTIVTVERHREFYAITNMKDQLYAHEGIICLGSSQDNGLAIHHSHDYHFTYPDIGTTLQRLLALQPANRWHMTAIVNSDRLSTPLAVALSQLLNLPLHTPDTLRPHDKPLLVLTIGREAELLNLMLQELDQTSVTFCLALNWQRHSSLLPDIVGIAARGTCSVPWEPELRRLRADGAPPEQVECCIQQATSHVLHACASTPPDPTLNHQIAYYTQSHRRLRFAPPLDGTD
jgi:tetratricopeptide (TPR) repeat protein